MARSSPDWSKCPASDITGADLPPAWKDTSVLECGFIYPSEQPMAEFQDCCLNEPLVQNGCFHYCQTDNGGIFGGCVSMNVAVNGSLQVSCNTQTAAKNAANGLKEDKRNWKTRMMVLSLAALSFV